MNGIKLAIKKQHGGEVVPMGWPILLAPRLLPGKAVLSWVSRVAARYDLVPSQLSFGLRAPGLARAATSHPSGRAGFGEVADIRQAVPGASAPPPAPVPAHERTHFL